MTDPRIIVDHARRTGMLKLSHGEAIRFYPFAMLPVALLSIFLQGLIGIDFILFADALLIAIFLIIFLIRRKTLRFTVIETRLPRERLIARLKEAIKFYGWEIKVFEPDIIIVDYTTYIDGNFDPPLDIHRNGGERITIVFDYNRVLVNSIVNIDKESRYSEGGTRKLNRENVDMVRKEIMWEEKI